MRGKRGEGQGEGHTGVGCAPLFHLSCEKRRKTTAAAYLFVLFMFLVCVCVCGGGGGNSIVIMYNCTLFYGHVYVSVFFYNMVILYYSIALCKALRTYIDLRLTYIILNDWWINVCDSLHINELTLIL